MTTDEYLTSIHLTLVENPLVARYDIVRQRVTSQSGYLRVRVTLTNGDFLEASEFFRLTATGIQVVDYRHQWMHEDRTQLRARWDSANHHPELENAPHHCHDGDESNVIPGEPLSIQEVLQIIADRIQVLPGVGK